MDASIAIQVLPKAEGREMIRIIDKVIEYIQSRGLNTFVGPFETTVEGAYDELMDIVKECQLICIREGAPGVSSYVKIAFNPKDGVLTIDDKVSKYHNR